ncbi:hypothetical protein [Streptomyces sp. NPDC059909]|uniref:hypothetical protein n=1 Tax=Streptomyces sp. NPDC059909 TaxID=3346998 RepID=UPI00364F9E16
MAADELAGEAGRARQRQPPAARRKIDAVTHALAKKDARIDRVQAWADHKDSRTTQRYNKRKQLLDDSAGYGLASDVAGALEHGAA